MHVGRSQSTALRLLRKMDLIPKKPSATTHVLSEADKKRRAAICRDLPKKNRRGSFFHRIITLDEKWCLYDAPDQSMQWVKRDEKPSPVQRKNIHGKKSMLTVFWCIDGPILWKLVPQGKPVGADYVCQEFQEMDSNAEKCGKKRDQISLLWDNCRPHFAKEAQEKLEEFYLEIFPQLAYNSDLAPSDSHLLRSLTHWLKGIQLRSEDDLKLELSAFFESKKRSFFDYGIRSLAHRWQTVFHFQQICELLPINMLLF
ncbi:transposase [Ancylostoma duodenale]|uniref:Transposase n=1 Tax=Ancylostoma duodenale TaxID=51022 RepID=A0A0C2CS18_9BILA|nr:transposase [Ancylostoma duodenale]